MGKTDGGSFAGLKVCRRIQDLPDARNYQLTISTESGKGIIE